MRDAPNQIQGNDWVRHGLAPRTITHIVHSCYEEWEILRDIPTRETTLLSPKLRRLRYCTLTIGKCCQNVGIWWGWTTSLPLKMTCNGRYWCIRSFNPKMGVYKDQRGDMKWSYENISTWSSDWPKEWLFSVQSSSTNIIEALQRRKLYSSHLEEEWML
jgi:hypothetical protein